MFTKKLKYLSFVMLFVVSVKAQIVDKSISYIPHNISSKNIIELPNINVDKLLMEDEFEAKNGHKSPRFAYAHEVNFTPFNSGDWKEVEGGKVWTFTYKTHNEFSSSLTLVDVSIPEGSYITFYNPNTNELAGPFTQKSTFKSKLGTQPIHGNTFTIKYFEPNKAPKGTFKVKYIAEAYKNVFDVASSFKKGFNSSGTCNNNVVCPEGDPYKDQINSVVLLIKGNGTRWCSGCMIGNTDKSDTPYLLTAYHCVDANDNGSISTAEYIDLDIWTFIFNYESPDCSPSADGTTTNSISGSSLVASWFDSDYALLELSSVPPLNYTPFYAGWDRTTAGANNAYGIHHPSGDVKKISFENDVVIESPLDVNRWRVPGWDDGPTEGGSSGSPLFNQFGKVVGQLYGGLSSCGSLANADLNDDFDEYGKFNVSWDGNTKHDTTMLSKWLDPTGKDLSDIEGYYIYPLFSDSNQFDYDFKMYPNPTSKNLFVSAFFEKNDNAINLEFVDYTGRIVLKTSFPNRVIKYSINISGLAQGCYFVKVNNGVSSFTEKLLIVE